MNRTGFLKHRGRQLLAAAGMGVVTLSAVATANTAHAFPQLNMPVMSAAILSSGQAGPTPAWIAFCRQMPDECAHDPSEPAVIALNQETWKLLVDVNERVNAKILPVTDQDHWGVADRWDYPDDGIG